MELTTYPTINDTLVRITAPRPGFTAVFDLTEDGARDKIAATLNAWADEVDTDDPAEWSEERQMADKAERQALGLLADELTGRKSLDQVEDLCEYVGLIVSGGLDAAPTARDGREELILRPLRDDAGVIARATDRRRRRCVWAYRQGVAKSRIAEAAGITRQTLDRWIEEADKEGNRHD